LVTRVDRIAFAFGVGGVLVLFGECVVGEAAVSGVECFFLALAAFGPIDYRQPRCVI
jgi:hypothetical protein